MRKNVERFFKDCIEQGKKEPKVEISRKKRKTGDAQENMMLMNSQDDHEVLPGW